MLDRYNDLYVLVIGRSSVHVIYIYNRNQPFSTANCESTGENIFSANQCLFQGYPQKTSSPLPEMGGLIRMYISVEGNVKILKPCLKHVCVYMNICRTSTYIVPLCIFIHQENIPGKM